MRVVRLLGAALLSTLVAVGLSNWSSTRDRWVQEVAGQPAGSVTLSLEADGPIQGWLENATPRLEVRCHPTRVVEFHVVPGLPAAVEPGNQRTVRYWFDRDEDTLTTWTQSNNRQVLAAPAETAPRLASRLATAQRFYFAYIPFNADPARAAFSVTGFDDRWKKALAMCGTSAY